MFLEQDKTYNVALRSGSRDGSMVLWRVEDENNRSSTSLKVDDYSIQKPVVIRTCRKAEKVRAIAVNDQRMVRIEIALYYNACWLYSEFNTKYLSQIYAVFSSAEFK